jgi:hypothetical protein
MYNFILSPLIKPYHEPYNLQGRDREQDDRTELVRMLIHAGADPTLTYDNSWGSGTSLTLALDELEGTVSGSSQQVIPSISKHLRLDRSPHINQERFHLMLDGAYIDLNATNELSGPSIWLHACIMPFPDIIRRLLAAGCSVADTYVEDPACANEEGYRYGWSCLFFAVLHASRPEYSLESESLRTLLGAGADPFLRDAKGLTIFDHVDGNFGSHFAGSYFAGYR